MAVRVGELEPRQLDRMRAELGEIILAQLAYPPFFDFRADRQVMRPIDQAKRDEVALFVNSINLAQLDYTDIASVDLRRFVERLFLRYLEVNTALRVAHQARRLPELRAQIPRLAAEFQRGAQAFLNGAAPNFGGRRPTPLWATPVSRDTRLPPEERVHNTRVLEAILLRGDTPSGALTTSPASVMGSASSAPSDSSLREAFSPFSPFAAPASPAGRPTSYPANPIVAPQMPTSPGSGPLAVSQSRAAAARQAAPAGNGAIADQPTGPLRSIRQSESEDAWLLNGGSDRQPARANAASAVRSARDTHAANRDRDLPPDLYHLYSDYLLDMQPDAPLLGTGPLPPTAPVNRMAMSAPEVAPVLPHYPPAAPGGPDNAEREVAPPFWRTGATSAPLANPAPVVEAVPVRPAPVVAPAPAPVAPTREAGRDVDAARNDQLIFWQLRYQLEAYVRRAAHSYGVQQRGDDPASMLDALRRSGFVDEADLRIAEGIFALTDRVTARGYASIDDYQEALMLYLLYHRSHLRN